MSGKTDTVGVAGDRIRSITERSVRLDEEIKGMMEMKKEIFTEAKGEGLDVKVLKEILKVPRQYGRARRAGDATRALPTRRKASTPAAIAPNNLRYE